MGSEALVIMNGNEEDENAVDFGTGECEVLLMNVCMGKKFSGAGDGAKFGMRGFASDFHKPVKK